MLVAAYAVLTVVAWGTWIGLADTVRTSSQVKTFSVTAGNVVFALVVATVHGDPLCWLWMPFLGGLLWALGNTEAPADGCRGCSVR